MLQLGIMQVNGFITKYLRTWSNVASGACIVPKFPPTLSTTKTMALFLKERREQYCRCNQGNTVNLVFKFLKANFTVVRYSFMIRWLIEAYGCQFFFLLIVYKSVYKKLKQQNWDKIKFKSPQILKRSWKWHTYLWSLSHPILQ
jgi:hypothetical protein